MSADSSVIVLAATLIIRDGWMKKQLSHLRLHVGQGYVFRLLLFNGSGLNRSLLESTCFLVFFFSISGCRLFSRSLNAATVNLTSWGYNDQS